jgi:hypothetical protein
LKVATRARGRIDANHLDIVHALRQSGVSVQSLASIGGGCPDLLCGLRGVNYLFEVKNHLLRPSARRLTAEEDEWHANWLGQVRIIESIEDAWRTIGLIR